MKPPTKYEIGQRIGRLSFVGEAAPRVSPSGVRHRRVTLRCDCGNVVVVGAGDWRSGHTSSCGCLHQEVRRALLTTHGQGRTPLNIAWSSMRQRCTLTVSRKFSGYEGVACDQRWETFDGFVANPPTSGRPFEPGLHLARFADLGPYSPENTRWLTGEENIREMNERKMVRLADGRFARDVARANGIPDQCWRSRYYRGMSIEDAVTIPSKARHR